MIPLAGIKSSSLPRAFLTTEQALKNKPKCFITKEKMQRKGKLPISLLRGSYTKQKHFFPLEFHFSSFNHKHVNKYKLPQDTIFFKKSHLERLTAALQFE